jgi:hypothetical protein
MAGKLSANAQQRVALLEGYTMSVGRLNSLVEQYAAAKTGHENLNASIKRLASQMKISFMNVGLAQMSQLCGAIEQTAARGSSQGQKGRTLREHVGSLKFQIDLAIRTTIREDEELTASKKEKAAADKAK